MTPEPEHPTTYNPDFGHLRKPTFVVTTESDNSDSVDRLELAKRLAIRLRLPNSQTSR